MADPPSLGGMLPLSQSSLLRALPGPIILHFGLEGNYSLVPISHMRHLSRGEVIEPGSIHAAGKWGNQGFHL